MGLLTVASQRQSHWQSCSIPWRLEKQVSAAFFCRILQQISRLGSCVPECQFSSEWCLPRLGPGPAQAASPTCRSPAAYQASPAWEQFLWWEGHVPEDG